MTVTLGVPKVNPEMKAHYSLFLTGRTLKGSLFGGWKPKSDLPSLVDMYTKKVSGYENFLVELRDQTSPLFTCQMCRSTICNFSFFLVLKHQILESACPAIKHATCSFPVGFSNTKLLDAGNTARDTRPLP